jgi:hypothetical protein
MDQSCQLYLRKVHAKMDQMAEETPQGQTVLRHHPNHDHRRSVYSYSYLAPDIERPSQVGVILNVLTMLASSKTGALWRPVYRENLAWFARADKLFRWSPIMAL